MNHCIRRIPVHNTHLKRPNKRWLSYLTLWVPSTLMTFAFITLPATSAMAKDFAYELTATGTESPDVTFSVELSAIGKATVIKQKGHNDNFPSFSLEAGWLGDCTEKTETFCLDDHCEVDYTQGDGKGYESFTEFPTGLKSDTSEMFQNSNKNWCLKSRVEICSAGKTSATIGGGVSGTVFGTGFGAAAGGVGGAAAGAVVGAIAGAITGAITGGTDANYNGYHVIYGKCRIEGETWKQTQKADFLKINEKEGWVKFAEYDGEIGSSEGVPNSAIVDQYQAAIVSKSPSDAPIQVGMFNGDPNTYAENGKELWIKTTYRPKWSHSKQGTASIPTSEVMFVDSIDAAPNADTIYTVSITVPPSRNTYTQNKQGIVDAIDFMGWLSGSDHEFFVTSDMSLRPPLAFIDSIIPNPTLVGTPILFKGHGKYGTDPNPPITNATWRTNRSSGKTLHTCSTSPCNFADNNLETGQHLISFYVEALGSLTSPETTEVLTINTPPFASITLIESTAEKDGIIKAVKWDDSTGHEPIQFVGQAIDLDGTITEYKWESNRDGIFGTEASFSYNNLSLGMHKITFSAKDDEKGWSNPVTKKVEVMKPPTLLVHGLWGEATGWGWEEGTINGYHIHRLDINKKSERFSYGAKKVSEKIKELTEEYGVPKVNIVAHSMGGLNSRWYIQNPGYRDDVNKLIMLGTPNHGSTLSVLLSVGSRDGAAIYKSFRKNHVIISRITNFIAPIIKMFKGGGPALLELNPQSSALIALNRNKKDEGYEGDEPDDNISTVYGNQVPYFSLYSWFWIPGLTHYHVTKSIVLVSWSIYTDFVVHEDSAKLDNIVISERFGHGFHTNLPTNEKVLEKALYYLGYSSNVKRTTRQAQKETPEKVNMADALAGHVLYAPDNGQFATISAGESIEQAFEVDATINNLHVMLMSVVTENSIKPSLSLLSPSGEVIDENTVLSNVVYDNDNPNGATYHLSGVEPGTWTVIIESASSESIEYALIVTGETNFWVGIEEGTQVEPGEPFTIQAYAQKDGSAMSGLDVSATLVKTLDEGERIGKYGAELRDTDPVTVALTDMGDGRYELVYEDTVAPGTYRIFITATDPATEASRVAFTTFFVEYDYELVIQSDDIRFSNDAPAHHETITISADIHNDSGIEAKGVEVWFANGSLGEGGTVFAKETIEYIAAGGSTPISVSWLATAGTHDIFVIVSPMNTFIETNLDNNTASKTIIVADKPPIAYAGMDQKARVDSHIFLDGSGSKDELKLERYEWDIDTNVDSDGDSIADNDVDLTGVRPFIPAGSYTTLGEYEIKLTVFDAVNQSHSDTITVQLTEEYDFEPPVAEAGPDQTLAPKTPVYFDASGSHDNYGIATYIWDIDTKVDSNEDGIADNDVDLVGMRAVLPWGYAEKDFYTVKLTVTDVAGNDPTTDFLIVDTGGQIGPYRTYGYVKDVIENPIAGVTVQVGDKTTVSDATGYWEINGLYEGEYTITTTKEGHTFQYGYEFLRDDKTITVGENAQKVKVNIQASSILNIDVIPFTQSGGDGNQPSYLKALYAEQALPQGENLIYLITVTNQGDKIAKEVVLTDTLPIGTELASMESLTGGDCDISTMTCHLPDLAPGANVNVQVEVSNNQTAALLNTVQVTANEYPSDVQVTTTAIKPYLSVSISDYPDPVEMLKPLSYTVDVELSEYAPSDASGIQLVMTLPSGVELKTITSDQASCDTSKLPIVTCNVTDLSIASKATLKVNAILNDAGLLLLTNQAEITANEYPTYATIERTEIVVPDDIAVDIAFVIDITGSMQQEINSVREALKEFIAEIDAGSAPLIALITFRDVVKIKAFTRDLNVLLSAIDELFAWGGGTCPEASIEALKIATPHIKPGGSILFATDASPYADADMEGMTEMLSTQGVHVNVMLTGDCSMAESWNNLP